MNSKTAFPHIDVATAKLSETQLPKKIALQYKAIVLKTDDGQTEHVALVKPNNPQAIQVIKRHLKDNVLFYAGDAQAIDQQLSKIALEDDSIQRFAKMTSIELLKDAQTSWTGAPSLSVDKNMINQLLNHLFARAVELDATDIHIELAGTELSILYRVAKVLNASETLPDKISDALRQKLIMLGHGDICLITQMQDLGFQFQLPKQTLDIRFSYLPTLTGYSIVMRIIKGAFRSRPLSDILHDATIYNKTQQLLQGRQGLFLITGPTGSGKSTLLYAMLNHMIAQGNYKVLTMEDPIEATLPGANQIAIKPEMGMDFSDVIRSALRQDPDILIIGEIRDPITAQMACRAAMTGIMVIASLHTQNSVNTIGRLVDLNAQPFIIGTGIRAVIATRLASKLCSHCKTDYSPNDGEKEWLKRYHYPTTGYQYSPGCAACRQQGHVGLMSIQEMLTVSNTMKQSLYERDVNKFNHLATQSLQGQTLVDHAMQLAQAGQISLSEAMSIALEFDI